MKKEEPKQEEKKVRMLDIVSLQRLIAPFEQKRMQGILVSRLNQYLISAKIITLVDGAIRIYDPHGYTWYNAVEEARQKYEASKNPKLDLRSMRPASLVKTMPRVEESEDEKLRAEALEALA